MLKFENLPRTNSTKYETQNILVKFQQNEHTPGHNMLEKNWTFFGSTIGKRCFTLLLEQFLWDNDLDL